MAFDDVFAHLGDFGRYQKRIYFLLCLTTIVVAFHKLAGVFLEPDVSYRCRLPLEDDNATFELPPFLNDSTTDQLKCEIPAQVWEKHFDGEQKLVNASGCKKWIFDTSQFSTTIVSEWKLVCEWSWMRVTADAVFMVGDLIGSTVFGAMSDRFGRKPVLIFSLALQGLAGILTALSPEYYSFIIMRTVIGASTAGICLISYVIGMELVGPRSRLFAGILIHNFFAMGYILLALIAYLIRGWRLLQFVISLPAIFFLVYWWYIPESLRWLLTKGRISQAREVISKAVDVNKVPMTESGLDALVQKAAEQPEDSGRGSFTDLLRYPNLRKKSLIIFFNWFVNNSTYYGLSWSTSSLGGNTYLIFFISGLVEFPAYAFLLLTLDRWGRRKILSYSMIVASIGLILTAIIPQDQTVVVVILVMIGKMAISASFGVIYIFSAELYPTVVRNVGMGASSTVARIGGVVAPYVNLLGMTWKPLPQLVFGLLSLSGGLSALLLPETLNKMLPDTIVEGENFT